MASPEEEAGNLNSVNSREQSKSPSQLTLSSWGNRLRLLMERTTKNLCPFLIYPSSNSEFSYELNV